VLLEGRIMENLNSTWASSTDALFEVLLSEKTMSVEFRLELNDIAEEMLKKVEKKGNLVLHNLDINKCSEDELEPMITTVPGMLLKKSDSTLCDNCQFSIPFIPFLAEQGENFNVGGEGNRGGMLLEDPNSNKNILETLAGLKKTSNDVYYDSLCLDTMMRLKEANLLIKEDVKVHDLLYCEFFPECKSRFDYLLGLDPGALKIHSGANIPRLIHSVITETEK
jgi:hypothetical protein